MEQFNWFDDYNFKQMVGRVDSLYDGSTIIYPEKKNVFRAFDVCPFEKTKVVILGQDPYHQPGRATGLAFDANGCVPVSLRNIYEECGISLPLVYQGIGFWPKQGVLLLNSALTVEKDKPGSHMELWEDFTDYVIQKLSSRGNVVFMLWGAFARTKKHLINSEMNLILEAPHPSGFSAHKGFFGCKHFEKCNSMLESWGYSPIKW